MRRSAWPVPVKRALWQQSQAALALQGQHKSLSDEELKAAMLTYREATAKGQSTKPHIPAIFALAGECCRRHLGLTPFAVQYLAALSLMRGEVAHMNTGEGKTLTAVLAACCKALEGRGVHVVTVNEYLARRDYEDNLPVFEALGFTAGLSLSGMDTAEKQQAYQADITYTTATEAGFDYLRDSVATKKSARVQGALHYAIIDEADSILLDEAVTPMILSGGGEGGTDEYLIADNFAKYLKPAVFAKLDEDLDIDSLEADYVVDQRQNNAILTARGADKAEQYYRIQNLYDQENLPIYHRILQAISAYGTLKKDEDYILRDGKVCIVDRNTGRVMEGRRYSLGLHQAVEAREKMEIHQESRTLASITYQKFFSLYGGICGMTGTAWPARKEFAGTFHMAVRRIPPNRPCIRIDRPDRYFASQQEKLAAVAEETRRAYAIKRPVLIGTPNDFISEEVSRMLAGHHIPHLVLGAKQDADEAAVVASAGLPGSVIVATNMAGRGTDIRLGGGQEAVATQVRALGGLLVLGTQRQRSRRIDDQLIGRSGRQGDPGESLFFVCPEDEVLRLFGIPMKKALGPRQVSRAQRLAQSMDAAMRKGELEADSILQEHRQNVLKDRERLIEPQEPAALVQGMIASATALLRRKYAAPTNHYGEFRSAFSRVFGRDALPADAQTTGLEAFATAAGQAYAAKAQEVPKVFDRLACAVLLQTVDEAWSSFLEDFLTLKTGYRLMAMGKADPRPVLITHSAQALNRMNEYILEEGLRRVFHCRMSASAPDA